MTQYAQVARFARMCGAEVPSPGKFLGKEVTSLSSFLPCEMADADTVAAPPDLDFEASIGVLAPRPVG